MWESLASRRAENYSMTKPNILLSQLYWGSTERCSFNSRMAAAMNRLGCSALRYTSRIPVRRKARRPEVQCRYYKPSPVFHKRDGASGPPKKKEREAYKFDIKSLDPEARAAYMSLTPEQRTEWEEEAKQFADYMSSPEVDSAMQGEASQAAHEAAEEMPHVDVQIPRIKPGLMALGEAEPQDSGEDEEFEGDDITSLAHGELEQHREMRHYARIAAWEMPLLSSMPPNPPSYPSPLSKPSSIPTSVPRSHCPPLPQN